MTNLDPKHLDAQVAELRDWGNYLADEAAAAITALRAENDMLSNLWQIEHDHATALRAQIDRERAATIEAAARTCWAQVKRRADQIANSNVPDQQRARWVAGRIQAELLAKAVEAMHTDATRAAMDAIRREAREQALLEAANLYTDGHAPGVGGWGYFAAFYDAILALAASIPPDPDTNAG